MSRRAAVVVLALTLNPALVRAQDLALTVTVPSADVYKGPSNVTPVIGRAPRGTVLPIARNLGSWVKVPWPAGPDGIGYVHVTMGRIGPPSASRPVTTTTMSARAVAAPAAAPAPAPSPAPAPARASAPIAIAPVGSTSMGERVAPSGARATGTPVNHFFGIGGLAATASSGRTFGATVRAWRNSHLGIQVGFARETMTGDIGADRVTSMQVEPGVVYGLFDRVSDYIWIRPYVGSVVSFRHQTLNTLVPAGTAAPSDNGVGLRIFGGGELMFASLPRFGLSIDAGYRRLPTPFPGFDAHRLSASLAGHWYIK